MVFDYILVEMSELDIRTHQTLIFVGIIDTSQEKPERP